jgi:hypothetical protein
LHVWLPSACAYRRKEERGFKQFLCDELKAGDLFNGFVTLSPLKKMRTRRPHPKMKAARPRFPLESPKRLRESGN